MRLVLVGTLAALVLAGTSAASWSQTRSGNRRSWVYTVTPAQGSWRGSESARSAAVTVPGV